MTKNKFPGNEDGFLYSSAYEGLPWFSQGEGIKETNCAENEGHYPCPGNRLEEYVINLERANFYSLNRKLEPLKILLNQYRDFSFISSAAVEDLEEFSRQRIVHGLGSHVLSCELCTEQYDKLLIGLARNEIASVIPERKRKKLEDIGLLNRQILAVAQRIDKQLLGIYRE